MEGMRLYPFQEEDVNNILMRKHTLLASELGTGKTVVAIEAINRTKARRVLCIVKASIKINWRRKLEEWLDSPREIQIVNKRTDIIEPFAEIIIVNYDLVIHSHIFYQLKRMRFEWLFCDESHYLKNLKTKRTMAILSRNGLIHQTARSLMITGTPVLNRPSELYPILKVLAPDVIAPYNDYWAYAKRYCAAWMDGFGLNDKGASYG
jgi:SWI/SNF-related matrix-associated actin-dependent regulator 1 of chromatin subfamily A